MSSPFEAADGVADLGAFQRWFHGQVIRPTLRGCAPATEPLAQAAREVAVEDAVLPSASLSAAERMAIYAEMYWLRTREALAEDYPSVHALLGDAEFDRFVREYLTRFPSTSFTLDHTGSSVPELFDQSASFAGAALLGDVARLERAVNLAFHAEPADALAPVAISQVPVEQWPELGFRLAPSVSLLALDYPANAIVSAVHDEQPLPALEREPGWVLVWRRDFVVWRQALTRAQFAVLEALGRGRTMGEAVSAAEEVWTGAADELEGELFGWFAEWLREGLFTAIALPQERAQA